MRLEIRRETEMTHPMSNYITRVTRLSVTKPGEPIFSELCTHVSIDDEAAGEYVTIKQQSGCPDVSPQKISVSDEIGRASCRERV